MTLTAQAIYKKTSKCDIKFQKFEKFAKVIKDSLWERKKYFKIIIFRYVNIQIF